MVKQTRTPEAQKRHDDRDSSVCFHPIIIFLILHSNNTKALRMRKAYADAPVRAV